jgi:hypothetical protein
MWNEMFKDLSNKYNPRFGQISVAKGYVSSEQVKQALMEQLEDDLANRSHRLLGEIMLAKGWMTANQVKKVLKELLSRKQED